MKQLLIVFIILIISACNALKPTHEQADLLITHARIITGNGDVLENASLAIRGNRIIGINSQQFTASKVIDASGKTVLPGLIDAHAHIFIAYSYNPVTSEKMILHFYKNHLEQKLLDYLHLGFTTVFSPGDYWPYIRDAREDLVKGAITGPRLFIAGPIFSTPGGHPSVPVCENDPWCREHLAIEVVNRQMVREKIALLAGQGVDAIKLVYDDGAGWTDPPGRYNFKVIPDSLLNEINQAAHQHKLRVLVHPPSVLDEVPEHFSDVDGFVHAPLLFKENGKAFTDFFLREKIPVTSTMQNLEQDYALAAKNLKLFIDNGVTVAFGTDAPWVSVPVSIRREVELFKKAGIDNLRLIQSMTKDAAVFLNKEAELGTLDPGKLADILIVDGDPISRLEDLALVAYVIKDGKVLIDHIQFPDPAAKFQAALKANGLDAAVSEFRDLKRKYPSHAITEAMVNRLGYELLSQKNIPAAIAVFRLNTEWFAGSYNTFDSLGEAYELAGDTTNALSYYKHSLQLNPGNKNAVDKIKLLEK